MKCVSLVACCVSLTQYDAVEKIDLCGRIKLFFFASNHLSAVFWLFGIFSSFIEMSLTYLTV